VTTRSVAPPALLPAARTEIRIDRVEVRAPVTPVVPVIRAAPAPRGFAESWALRTYTDRTWW
jgi:hypothetical protein